MLHFNYHSILKKFFIFFLISVLTKFPFSVELFSFYALGHFLSLLLLIASCNPWWSDRMQSAVSVFLYLFNILCVLIWGRFWRNFQSFWEENVPFSISKECSVDISQVHLIHGIIWPNILVHLIHYVTWLEHFLVSFLSRCSVCWRDMGIEVTHYHCLGQYVIFGCSRVSFLKSGSLCCCVNV